MCYYIGCGSKRQLDLPNSHLEDATDHCKFVMVSMNTLYNTQMDWMAYCNGNIECDFMLDVML